MENLLRNFVNGFRLVAKNPGSTALSSLLLSIAIGMVAVVFGVLVGVIYRGLPFEDSQRIVSVERFRVDDGTSDSRWLFDDFKVLASDARCFEELSAVFMDPVIITSGERKERFFSAYVEPNFFNILRAQPQLGRFFNLNDCDVGTELTAVISDSAWESFFNRTPNVIGERILVDGVGRTIIGVADALTDFPFGQQIWMPVTVDGIRDYTGRGSGVLAIGRLKEAFDLKQANQDISRITQQLGTDRPETNSLYSGGNVFSFVDNFVGSSGRRFWHILFGITLLVLLMACANVSNIMMGKTLRRQNELAIRSALGASRATLVSQLLTESLAVALLSTVGSLLFAEVYSRVVLSPLVVQMNLPAWMEMNLNISCFAFVAFVSIGAVMFAGLIPALRSTKSDLQSVLREGTRTGSSGTVGRFSKILIGFQISLAVVVLTGVGLTLSSLLFEKAQFGFYDVDDVVFGRLSLDANSFPNTAERFPIFETFRREVENHPAFSGLAISNEHSLRFRRVPVMVDGVDYPTDADRPNWLVRIASPGYFKTLGMKVLEGREFTPEDIHGTPLVAMVMKKTADRIWPGESPIGKRIIIDRTGGASDSSLEKDTLTIVGVFPDVWNSTVYDFDPDGFARPLGQETWGDICFYAKGTGNFALLEKILREIGNKVHRDLAVTQFSPLTEVMEQRYIFDRMVLELMISFGMGALVMVAGGLYGVLSFAVGQRKQEFAIRTALGASSERIVWMTFLSGVINVLWGLGFGVLGAIGMHKGIQGLMRPYHPDLAYLGSLFFGLLLIAIVAIIIPAWRTTRIQPMQVLRSE